MIEINDRATAKLLRARAEKNRSQAVRALYAALDLTMAEAAGYG